MSASQGKRVRLLPLGISSIGSKEILGTITEVDPEDSYSVQVVWDDGAYPDEWWGIGNDVELLSAAK